MGCDIHGYIEVKKHEMWDEWSPCLNINSIIDRNYEMFAFLFGVRNDGRYIPLAEKRGLPANISEEVKEDYEKWRSDAHSASWITWAEIQHINWDELAARMCYDRKQNIIKSHETLPADWNCLFNIMKCIDRYHNGFTKEENIVESRPVPAVYQDNSRVRLVVWFDN